MRVHVWYRVRQDVRRQPEVDGSQSVGIETLFSTSEQFAALIKTEIARWGRVVKEANLSVE